MTSEASASRPGAASACLRLLRVSVVSILVGVVLPGCERKVELQTAPDMRKASEIAAALRVRGIEVERKQEKSGVTLSVRHADFPRAMEALRDAGLLRPSRPSVDETFGKRGIAPTPLEDRARRVHAIARELESTLMDIDGVITARVRVVPPERPAPGAPLAPASASVLVKHRAGVDLSPLMPGIARLVKNAVPGLAGEDDRHVVVMLVPEPPAVAAAPRQAAGTSVDRPALGGAALLSGAAAAGYFADRLLRLARRRNTEGGKDGQTHGARAG